MLPRTDFLNELLFCLNAHFLGNYNAIRIPIIRHLSPPFFFFLTRTADRSIPERLAQLLCFVRALMGFAGWLMHGREEGRKEEGPRDMRSCVCIPERRWWLSPLSAHGQRDGSPSPALSGGLVLRWSSATQYVHPYPSPTLTASLGPPLLLRKSSLLGHASNPQGPCPRCMGSWYYYS